jgi:uncharacterized 2Fe-2S/4Fe-4S cluster protein (DUF4445 family)
MKISLVSGREVHCAPGTSLIEALKQEGVFLTSSCGGKGTCGKCKVIIKSGSFDTRSKIKLSTEELDKGCVLACQTYPGSDISIEIPKESILTVEGKIATGKSQDLLSLLNASGAHIEPLTERSLTDNISDLERLRREIFSQKLTCLRVHFRLLTDLAKNLRKQDWEITLSTILWENCNEVTNIFPGNRKTPQYGVAIDIGTTTLVLYLIDLLEGSLIDIASTYNSQITYGDDVITRIVHATEHGALKGLNKAVTSDINELLSLLRKTHHIDIDSIDCFVVSGNPTMTHLFLGLDPEAIREEPYIPTANSFPIAFSRELDLQANPNTPVYTLPCVASYVGGDIVAGVLATRIHTKSELSMFIDIGTNGEIVLGNAEWLVAAACSAGPCFEGSGIKHGMRATDGAIEDVRIVSAAQE